MELPGMFNNKLRKLVKKPRLFFSDMAANQVKNISKLYNKKQPGYYEYTVVSAVYNVGRFLDDYFKSFINQKLIFKEHIQLILVDDGSTDNSADIIKKWQNKYPDNIKYVYQDNAGQSVARNQGLQHVKTEWVTFIDPDDFVDINYFYNLDKFINNHYEDNIRLLGCNIIMYYEEKNLYKDGHPLSYKFKNGNALIPLSCLEKEIQLSASTAFFRTADIINNNLYFDSRVKPNFEDAHFIAKYLMLQNSGHIAFLKDSQYFYRKRGDGTSTLDTSWTKRERFLNVPEFGYLDTLRAYKEKKGIIPAFIQRTVLYEIVWYCKWLVNHGERAAFLTTEEKNQFIDKIKTIFNYLDEDIIMGFDLAGAWFYHKISMLSFFKGELPNAQIVYVEKYDHAKGMVQLRYFTNTVGLEEIKLDGVDVIPGYAKTIKHDLLDDTFILERRLWVASGAAKTISVKVSKLPTRLSFAGKQHKNDARLEDIRNYFLKLIPVYETKNDYKNAWILMDRDTQADDNAEHLYRYIRKKHPDKKIYFALQKNSHDWARLEQDDFKLLEFGSREHKLALGSCSKVISSHANRYVTNYLGPRMLEGKHFVFLQHGVIKDDLSGWLNAKEDIHCFITTSPDEYHSICDDNSRYNYCKKEVFLTGLPRHDQLINQDAIKERLIIIMPTWRQTIVGPVIGEGEQRELNPLFMKTDFATHWYSVLHSPLLHKYSKKYNFKVAFFPHANIQPYLKEFAVPDYIEVITHSQGSIQQLFNRAAIMITDYSSVAFEMAVQNKQTIYYQFDADECFAGGHIYSKGYYDYKKHAFGPVVATENALFKELALALKNDAKPSIQILNRIQKTFPYRDGLNCKRTFEAIESLDAPLPEGYFDPDILKAYALQASYATEWKLAEERWKRYLFEAIDRDNKAEACVFLMEALRKQGNLAEAREIFNDWNEDNHHKVYSNILAGGALLDMAEHKWSEAINKWQQCGQDSFDNIKYCYCLYRDGCVSKLELLVKNIKDKSVFNFVHFYLLLAMNKWEEGIDYVKATGVDLTSKPNLHNKLLLTLSYCYQQLKKYKEAHECLALYETHIENDPQCRLKIARLAFLRKNWGKIISQLHKACVDINHLPQEHYYYYLYALIQTGKSSEAYSHIKNIPIDLKKNQRFISVYMDSFMATGNWNEAIRLFENLHVHDDELYFKYAISLRKAGRFSQALAIVRNRISKYNADTWLLRCELAQLSEEWEEAYNCWLSLYRHYPEALPENSDEKLQNLRLLRELSGKQMQVNKVH